MTNYIKLDDNRRLLCELFNNCKVGAEIGVDNGDFSAEICKTNPQLKLFAIDSWLGEYESHYQTAITKLNIFKNCEIVKKNSMEALKDFKDNSLDFVYIDADHSYESVYQDLNEWYKKVKVGGIVSGHDYLYVNFSHKRKPVRLAIDRFLEENDIKEFYMLNKNSHSSWYFIK